MKNFLLIGAAGYIAPRHMEAIKATGNHLLAAYDPFDSVGVIDRYFPEADFFTEFERFDRHIEKLKRQGTAIDFVSICSPNYLHDAHIRFGLRHGASVICEKPIVLNPWNIDALAEVRDRQPGSVYNILQLRLHDSVIELRNKIAKVKTKKPFNVKLHYYTSRGKWYNHSWKGDIAKSGGVATNIGVHFFDMLIWIFGPVKDSNLNTYEDTIATGTLQLERANVDWILSTNYEKIPARIKATGARTYRSIEIENEEFEFSGGFTELHTKSYQAILDGNGFNLEEAKPAIDLVHKIRQDGATL
jgi:UDP-N-acetyl-2-amino-2-deoxyglucuronate dehydrogenase